MKTKLLAALCVFALAAIAYAQSEGGVPGQKTVPAPPPGEGGTCVVPSCDNYPGTGCYTCGQILIVCHCFSGDRVCVFDNIQSTPCGN